MTIKGHVKTEDSNDLSLYTISFDRETYSSLNFEDLEIDAALSHFTATNMMTKDVLDKLFVVKEKEAKKKQPIPSVQLMTLALQKRL